MPPEHTAAGVVNVRLHNKPGRWRIDIEKGRIAAIVQQEETSVQPNPQLIDGEGGLALPPFVEPHTHLDNTLTAGEPAWNTSGTLLEAIERWSERKRRLTAEDVKARAHKALCWQIANGIQYVRAHVDVTDPKLTALKALMELRERLRPWVTLQLVAFPQEGIPSYPDGARLLNEAVAAGADVVGAIPHFEFTREYGVQSIDTTFDIAEQHGCPIDVHCDETDDEQSRFVEVLATRAYERNMGARVTASHTTAMHSYNNAYAQKLFGLILRSGINMVANPMVNIHLQGRGDSYPKRRGITRVKEMLDSGINVCFGHDNIHDAFYPLGTASVLQVLHLGLHVCHMMGYDDIQDSVRLITENAARALGIEAEYGLEVGKPANLIILPAENWFEVVRRLPPVLYSIRQGRVTAKTHPTHTSLFLDREYPIDFRR